MTVQSRPQPGPGRTKDRYGAFLGQVPIGQLLTALAIDQHAVFGVHQLRELGLSARAARGRAAVGDLHRIHRGVYSLVPPSLLTRRGRWMAAVLAAGPGAVLSHRCAAALHELRAYNGTKLEVTFPGRSGRAHPGIEIHRSRTLTDADVTTVNNIPCTAVARTLVDLADVIARRPLERAFDQAEIIGALNLRAVADEIDRNPHRAAARIVRELLEEHYIGSTATWSDLEEAFIEIGRTFDLPPFEVNQLIVLPDGGPPIRADFLFRAQRVVVEADSRTYHLTAQAFERDRDRDQRLGAHRFWSFRATWKQILGTADVVGTRLLALIHHAQRVLAASPIAAA